MTEPFPENVVPLLRNYLGATGPDRTPTRDAIAGGLPLSGPQGIQDHNPLTGKPINAAAVRCRERRSAVRLFLGNLEIVLTSLDAVCLELAKQNPDGAAAALATVGTFPAPSPAEFAEAFRTDPVSYSNLTGGTKLDPEYTTFELPGYSGPSVDLSLLTLAAELVAGGAERDRQVILLQAEIASVARQPITMPRAIDSFAKLLPEASSTAWAAFDVQVDLFTDFSSPDAAASMDPRAKHVLLRRAETCLDLAEQLHRTERTGPPDSFGPDQRQRIADLYDMAVRLLDKGAISKENPRREAVDARAAVQKSKLLAGLNPLGLTDAFIPVQRYTQLQSDASTFVEAAIDAKNKYIEWVGRLEQLTEEEMDVEQQRTLEATNLDITRHRQHSATIGVDKIDEQISAIDDHLDALDHEEGISPFRNIAAALPSGGLGIAGAAFGTISSWVQTASQREELQHQRRMAQDEKEIALDQESIAGLEANMSQQRLTYLQQKLTFLEHKTLNADLIRVIVELERRRVERLLESAVLIAYMFERALAFFLGEPDIRHIAFDYLDRPAGIPDAPEALKADLLAVTAERDRINELGFDFFEQAVSLRQSYPLQFNRFLQTGRMTFEYSLYNLSKLRPASHQCRLNEVGVEVKALVPVTGFSGTLTHHGRFTVRDLESTLGSPQPSRLLPTAEQVEQALAEQRHQALPVAAVGGVLIYDQEPTTHELSQQTQFVSHTPPTEGMLDVFQRSGPTGLWELVIQDFDHLSISDVVLHMAIVSKTSDVTHLGPRVTQLVEAYEAELSGNRALDQIVGFSLRQDFPDAFFALQSGGGELVLGPAKVTAAPGAQVKQVVLQAVDSHGKAVAGITLEVFKPDADFTLTRTTLADGFTEDVDATPPEPTADQLFDLMGPWQLRLADSSQAPLVGDVRLFFAFTAA